MELPFILVVARSSLVQSASSCTYASVVATEIDRRSDDAQNRV